MRVRQRKRFGAVNLHDFTPRVVLGIGPRQSQDVISSHVIFFFLKSISFFMQVGARLPRYKRSWLH